jgi:hypothetical protein
MKVDGGVKSLLQGVSQQPARDRLPGQGSLQQNMRSDPVEGLSRRCSTELIDQLLSGATTVHGFHDFTTKDQRDFIAVFYNGGVKVTDLNGVPFPVTVEPDASAYITGEGLRFHTDENLTYVANPSVVVEMTSDIPAYYNAGAGAVPAGIIQVLGGQYGKKYSVQVKEPISGNTWIVNHTTPDGGLPTHSENIGTKRIAAELYVLLVPQLPASYTSVLREDMILIYNTAGIDFKLTAYDDWGNVNIKASNETAKSTADLPQLAPHLYAIRIAEKADPEMDVWFKFIVEGQINNLVPDSDYFGDKGYWQECPAPDTPVRINNATMPHVLEYDMDDEEFTFRRAVWEDRKAGTIKSNPNPSFVSNTINDVGMFQSRLAFVSGTSEIMSRTNRSSDFWFASVAQQADTDPIDMRSRANSSILRALVPHNKDLVAFASKGQFITFGRSSLTPTNAALVLTTSFESELTCKPVSSGRNVFFATNFGKYSGIREFFAEGSTDSNDSRDITQPVRKYIKGKVTAMSVSPNYDTLIVHTDVTPEKLYMYQYIWNEQEKVQSAWSELVFSHPVVWSFFKEEILYLVYKIGTAYYLSRLSLDVQPSAGVNYHVYLDLQFDVPGTETQFVLPYDFYSDSLIRVVQGEGCPTPGLVAPIKTLEYDADTEVWIVTLRNNMQGGNVIVGIRYGSKYRPTMPMIKDEDNVKVGTGSLKVNKFLVSVFETGELTGQVISRYGNGPEVTFTARMLGDPDNILGTQPVADDTHVMPFGHNADLAELELGTDSHLPLNILDIEWEGSYNKRGRRVGNGE